jgi:hypothetical protein
MRKVRVVMLATAVVCGLVALAVSSGSSPAPASAQATPPTVTTGSASNIAESNATVNGTVNPNGQATTYYFKYGTTTAYGLQTTPSGAGSGTGPVAVHATLYGLSENTTYHYQLVAQSSAGTTSGTDETLTTSQSQAVVLGHEGFVSPGWVVGVELGCFHGTSTCTGHLTMSHNGAVIGQRDYSISADSGGFQNMVLNQTGQSDLGQNSMFHLLPVTVTATAKSGQTLSFVIHLARWVWH